MTHKPIILEWDGIIGAGKTFCVNAAKQLIEERTNMKVVIIEEPVSDWVNSGNLSRYYDDQNRWAYEFQTVAFVGRIRKCIEAYRKYGDNVDIYIMERSCISDRLFMSMLFENGTIDSLTMNNYEEWYALWTKLMPFRPNAILYVRTPISICMKRIEERGRESEKNITVEYQTSLQDKHDEVFMKGLEIDGEVIATHIVDISEKVSPELLDRLYNQLMSIISLHK